MTQKILDSLKDKVVVLTRPEHQLNSLSESLKTLGAIPIHIPAIKISPILNEQTAKLANQELESADWVIFTSCNGVEIFLELLNYSSRAIGILKEKKLAAIGPGTANKLKSLVRAPDAVPDQFISEAIAPCLGEIAGMRILVPRAKQARRALINELEGRGAVAIEIPIYDTISNIDPDLVEQIKTLSKPDYITFTSSSTVTGFCELMEASGKDWLVTSRSICIGPITAQTLVKSGVTPYRIAERYSVDGLIHSIKEATRV
mgnify:CR=1 FL=1